MWGSFRNLVYRVHHKHLLATWFTIQSGAAIAAFCVLWSLVHCAWSLLIENEADSHCAPQQLLAESCCLMLFGVTFYRFSVGDLRYLYWMGAAEESLKEWERQRLKGDLIALNVRALAFTGLAQSISKLSFFFLSFAILLLVDIPWLYLRHAECARVAIEDETLTLWRLSKCQHCKEALLRWLVNNAMTFAVLIVLLALHFGLHKIDAGDFLRLSITACVTNCFVDIFMTKWVYRPSQWR